MKKNKEDKEKILIEIISELIESGIKDRENLSSFKRKMAKKYRLSCLKNTTLLKTYHELLENESVAVSPERAEEIEHVLRKKPVRSLSGIVNVSVLTKPYPCPGKCIFCPEVKNIPKSYLAKEPAVQRALANKFHPYKQVFWRLESLKATGHPIDKIELRIIGATWSCYPRAYQSWFVKECFRAANNFVANAKCETRNAKPLACNGYAASAAGRQLKTKNLEKLQKENEKAKARIIGITIETRPDYIDLNEIKRLRKLGITRVELGVQTVYDDILRLNKRGHGIKETIKATCLLKAAGFKVAYQIMPDLPGSSFKKDIQMFKELFQSPSFRPDLLKIYPLALVREAPLYNWYKQKKYKPYTKKELIKLLVEIKKYIPRWCRVERVIRDIPSPQIVEGGAKLSNLREVVQKIMRGKGRECQCIRCREVGQDYDPKEKLYLFREDYIASQGQEVFLSFENKTRSKLYALLRLRLPRPRQSERVALPVLKEAAIIREVHAFGQLTPIAKTAKGRAPTAQHKGLGQKLIKQAEKIARQAGFKKIAVISGIGARNYYRKKLNFRLKDTYMIKNLK